MHKSRMNCIASSVVIACNVLAAGAADVSVTIRGEVESNQLTIGPLRNALVLVGDAVTVTFLVHSDDFVDSPQFPVRGYRIDKPTFLIQMGSESVGFPTPFPAGVTPYFSIRNNDPGVDGFLLGHFVDTFGKVPINGYTYPNFGLGFLRTFDVGTIWPTTNILDALGHYGFENMSSYDFRVVGVADTAPLIVAYESIDLELTCMKGDLNSDSLRDADDVTGFIDALLAIEITDTDLKCRADLNGNGTVGGDDIAMFVQCVTGAGCP